MAFASLATTADLENRGINTEDLDTDIVTALLASASAAVRDAAGGPIGQLTTTVSVPGGVHEWLDFPMVITAVTSIEVSGTPVTGWRLRSGRLWHPQGWRARYGLDFDITGTFGLAEVPADIVDLVCSLVAAGLTAVEDGYDPRRGVMSLAIDDYREGYAKGEDEVISPMELPERTRVWLRQRFGGGAYVTGTHR